jgi:glycosyltransferase involved in cell wall biosynthesis
VTSLPSISVVIPTYNRSAVLARTIDHLVNQDYPNELIEILVVDNSSDDTPAVVLDKARSAPVRIELIEGPRLPAIKRNIGLQRASGELVMFMNDDVWLDPDALAEHARSHAESSAPIAVLGHLRQSPEMPPEPFCSWFEPFAYHQIADRADQSVPYEYFWTMNISMPRHVMLERNLVFHEDWREIGEEDVELGYRWTRAGLEIIYNPRISGDHYHPHTLESASRVQESIGRGLRDFTALVPDPLVLERFGVFDWHNRPKVVARGIARKGLFNRVTVPVAERWLNGQTENTRVGRWMYWKILLHYTDRGWRTTPPREVQPVPTRSAAESREAS